MKLYLVINKDTNNYDYDFYDSFVICCNSEDEARRYHPSGRIMEKWRFLDWPDSDLDVGVECLGEANPNVTLGVVCSSFNAG